MNPYKEYIYKQAGFEDYKDPISPKITAAVGGGLGEISGLSLAKGQGLKRNLGAAGALGIIGAGSGLMIANYLNNAARNANYAAIANNLADKKVDIFNKYNLLFAKRMNLKEGSPEYIKITNNMDLIKSEIKNMDKEHEELIDKLTGKYE